MADLRDRAALGAHAGQFHRVAADRETVPARALGEPRVEVAVGELDHPVTPLADEVVMVALAAEPIADLARMMAERIDRPARAQRSQRPVHGGEADPLAASGECGVDLLCRRVVPLGGQNLEHREPLPGGPQAVTFEQVGGLGLRARGHFA